jgi:hypothetical protein
MEGVRADYSGFCASNGQKLGITVGTYVAVDESSKELRVQVWTNGDGYGEVAELVYPPRMKMEAREGDGYTVLPRMQGSLIPVGYPLHIPSGIIFERDAYMPLFGQVHKGAGYAAIYDTPYDARYIFKDDEVQPYFIPSLGSIAYKREMLFRFFADGDFNTIAKIYRAYRKERGRLVTLRDKIAKNPKVAELIGRAIVHTDAAIHIHPDSMYYEPNNPAHNDSCKPFSYTAKALCQLKENGADKVYLHLDGWGHHGYDNLHPNPFPIHEAAGGADGLRALQQTCHSIGYLFGIHDQYRDYYYDTPGFTLDNAVEYFDGSHFYSSIWYGGGHTYLCAKLAPDYVRRNYDEFERLGIKLDGSYLDVFSVVAMDECFNKDHPMTREECAKYRRYCLDMLVSRGIITSSEETVDCVIDSLALCHHSPFPCTDYEDPKKENVGIPIPLFNLVFHDCMVIPWDGIHTRGAWSIAHTDSPFIWALLCGGTIYYKLHMSPEDIQHGKIALDLHQQVALCDLVSHDILDASMRKRRSTFSDGTVVEADLDSCEFSIKYPDGRIVSGRD